MRGIRGIRAKVGRHRKSPGSQWWSPYVSGNLLGTMGYTVAQLAALPNSLKACGSWGSYYRAVDTGRIDTANGPSSAALLRDYDGIVQENKHKWGSNEPTQGAISFAAADALDATIPPLLNKRRFHLGIGRDQFNPAWVATDLGATPGNILTRVTNRINSIIAAYPSATAFKSIDVVNEVTSEDGTNPPTSSSGWRTTASAFYTAAHDATTLSTVLGGNESLWIWNAVDALHTAYPTARLCLTDFKVECGAYPNSGTVPILPPPFSVAQFDAVNSFRANKRRTERIKYEIWRMLRAGHAMNGVGYQMHMEPFCPPDLEGIGMSCRDWNRFGVVPEITELNVRNTGASLIPPHLTPAPNAALDRFGAWYANAVIKKMLQESLLDTFGVWSVALDGTGNGQCTENGGVDFPLRPALMLAIFNAVTPASRTLKRCSRTDLSLGYPMWVTNTSTISGSGNMTALTTAGVMQIPWTWFNEGWMPRPISASDCIIGSQFFLSAAPAASTVLLGYGNGNSGTPTNTVKLLIDTARNLSVEVRAGGVTVLTQQIAAALATSVTHKVAIRINGTSVKASVNGGAVQSFVATGSFNNQDTLYIMSNPDGTSFSANLRTECVEVRHGADWPNDTDLQTVGTVVARTCGLGIYMGD